MDSSQVLGDEAEECSSSESGWTTYIASPDHHHEVDDDENDKEKTDKTDNDDDGDDDDNDHDSMASDASSGHPTHPQLTCESSKGSHGSMTQYKHAEDEPPSKSPSGKQPCKRVGRKRDEKTKVDINQEWVLDSNSESCSHVQSGPKEHLQQLLKKNVLLKLVTRREKLLDFHPVVVLVKLLDLLPTWGLRAE